MPRSALAASISSSYEACTNLLHRFYYLLDANRYDDMLLLLEPHAVWRRQGGVQQGRAQHLTALNARSTTQYTRHALSNGFIDIISDDGLELDYVAYITAYKFDNGQPGKPPFTLSMPGRLLLLKAKLAQQPTGDWLIRELTHEHEFELTVATS